MDMSGEYRIPASRQTVWEALNDPEILKKTIPGCESLTKTGDNEMAAKVKSKVGPVSATFAGTVTLTDLNAPESYTINGEGSGGVAGFAKGGARVSLAEDGPSTTILRYTAHADVGGKIAQIGSRLIQGAAKKTADDFFGNLTALLTSHAEAAPSPAAELPPQPATEPVAAAAAVAATPAAPPAPAPAAPAAAPPSSPRTTSVPPASSPRPSAPPPAPKPAPGFFSKPLNLVIVALVVLILLWLIL